jgi:hypothetical protein
VKRIVIRVRPSNIATPLPKDGHANAVPSRLPGRITTCKEHHAALMLGLARRGRIGVFDLRPPNLLTSHDRIDREVYVRIPKDLTDCSRET